MNLRTICTGAVCCLGLCSLLGCQSTNGLAKKSKQEQLQIDQQVARAHRHFEQGEYAQAEAILEPLSREKTVHQPLYLYELSSAYLLDGKKEKAHQTLLATHRSIEGFFDQKSEEKAASLWGNESDKVFKGEPYERGTLYMLLALSFLEHGNVDNALAAIKTGLLADSDSENQSYQADYALLHFLAAKCYALRNEPELRDQMLDQCFCALTKHAAGSSDCATQLKREYARRVREQSLTTPPSRAVAQICRLASRDKLTRWLQQNNSPESLAQQVAKWVEQTTAAIDPLDFNAVVLLWNGTAPRMTRTGEYGEQRTIHPGTLPQTTHCSVLVDGIDYDGTIGLGDLSYQATTRGGRLMDNVLGKQAQFKGTMNQGGNFLLQMSQQDYGNDLVNLGVMLAAGLFKATAAATRVEADIRFWQNLPCQFELLTLRLEPGVHPLCSRQWSHATPLVDQSHDWHIDADAPLCVAHLSPPHAPAHPLDPCRAISPADRILFKAAALRKFPVDTNRDGEYSADERTKARVQLKEKLDRNHDGVVSSPEYNWAFQRIKNQFDHEMVDSSSTQPSTHLEKQ